MRTVLCDGCWDPLHYGHVLHLVAARQLGDKLYVSITDDHYVNKGPKRPVLSAKKRAFVVNALRCVDGVLIVSDVLEALRAIQPDIFVKGKEYEGKIQAQHQAYCYENNIQITFTDTEVYSSTELLHYYETACR